MTNISCKIERHSPGVSGPPSKTAWEIPESPAEKTPLRVLVVDDEALIRWSVTETLTGLGMAVVQAVDAASALNAIGAAGRGFDVIVLDLRLPDMDDLTLVAAVRACVPDAAVVLMTAFGTPEIVTEAYGLGVVNVLNKPFELDELSRVVVAAGSTATC